MTTISDFANTFAMGASLINMTLSISIGVGVCGGGGDSVNEQAVTEVLYKTNMGGS